MYFAERLRVCHSGSSMIYLSTDKAFAGGSEGRATVGRESRSLLVRAYPGPERWRLVCTQRADSDAQTASSAFVGF